MTRGTFLGLKKLLIKQGYFDFKERRRKDDLDLIARTSTGSVREFFTEDLKGLRI